MNFANSFIFGLHPIREINRLSIIGIRLVELLTTSNALNLSLSVDRVCILMRDAESTSSPIFCLLTTPVTCGIPVKSNKMLYILREFRHFFLRCYVFPTKNVTTIRQLDKNGVVYMIFTNSTSMNLHGSDKKFNNLIW